MISEPAADGAVECVAGFAARPQISHVIFDFDGTLSWLRHGWPELMLQLFRPFYPTKPDETEGEIHNLLLAEILSLNGKPTIHQMNRFHARVAERNGVCPSAEELLHEYQRRLDVIIARRTEEIHTGRAKPDEFVVHGARRILERMRARGLRLIILSGSIEPRVREEAQLLQLDDFFGSHIYGSTPDPTQFSKKTVIARIMAEESILGEHLLSFGDGPVEIEETKNVGGLAVAVASDEEQNGSGRCDAMKRRQLLDAGADMVIADFRGAERLMEIIFGK